MLNIPNRDGAGTSKSTKPEQDYSITGYPDITMKSAGIVRCKGIVQLPDTRSKPNPDI